MTNQPDYTGMARQDLRDLRQTVEWSRDGFCEGQPYVLTYSDIIEKLREIEALLARAAEPAARLREALEWALDNLATGIEWGGPFDDDHKQGVYHCTHCDARWKPRGDGQEEHKPECGLLKMRQALAASGDRPSSAAQDTFQRYGDKDCENCGHSNWAHGENGCSYMKDGLRCPCKEGFSNRQILDRAAVTPASPSQEAPKE